MTGLASYGAPQLEGNYSTWTELWEYTYDGGLAAWYYNWGVFQGDYLYIIYRDDTADRRFAVINLTDGSNKFLSTDGEYYTELVFLNDISYPMYNTITAINGGALVFSVRGKYLVIGRRDPDFPNETTKFEVWKDGVKVWTSPLASDAVSGATYYRQVGIRHDGKYIVALTDNEVLVCFEGS